MAGINQGVPETAIGEPIRLGSNDEFEIEQHPVSDRLIIRDTQNGKVAYVRKERGGQIGGDGVLIKALKEGKPMADDGRTYDTIQQAERAASSWVFVPPGTYNENVSINTQGLTLQGSGYNTLIQTDGGDNIISINEDSVTVRNLSVELTDISSSTYGISVKNNEGCTIENCTVIESTRFSIQDTATNNLIINNRIYASNAEQGIVLGESIAVGNLIDGIDGRGMADANPNGIYANNIIKDCSTEGINANQGNQIIVGNRVINSGENGISIFADNIIVANNRVSDSGSSDINDAGTGTVLDGNLTGASN